MTAALCLHLAVYLSEVSHLRALTLVPSSFPGLVCSGLAHSVSGADYSSVRAGAFMGLAMATAELGQEALLGDGYLANIPPSEFSMVHRAHLPEEIKVSVPCSEASVSE